MSRFCTRKECDTIPTIGPRTRVKAANRNMSGWQYQLLPDIFPAANDPIFHCFECHLKTLHGRGQKTIRKPTRWFPRWHLITSPMFLHPLMFFHHLMRLGTPWKRHDRRVPRQRHVHLGTTKPLSVGHGEGPGDRVLAAQADAAAEDGGVVDHGARRQIIPKITAAQHHLQPMVETMHIPWVNLKKKIPRNWQAICHMNPTKRSQLVDIYQISKKHGKSMKKC